MIKYALDVIDGFFDRMLLWVPVLSLFAPLFAGVRLASIYGPRIGVSLPLVPPSFDLKNRPLSSRTTTSPGRILVVFHWDPLGVVRSNAGCRQVPVERVGNPFTHTPLPSPRCPSSLPRLPSPQQVYTPVIFLTHRFRWQRNVVKRNEETRRNSFGCASRFPGVCFFSLVLDIW